MHSIDLRDEYTGSRIAIPQPNSSLLLVRELLTVTLSERQLRPYMQHTLRMSCWPQSGFNHLALGCSGATEYLSMLALLNVLQLLVYASL